MEINYSVSDSNFDKALSSLNYYWYLEGIYGDSVAIIEIESVEGGGDSASARLELCE